MQMFAKSAGPVVRLPGVEGLPVKALILAARGSLLVLAAGLSCKPSTKRLDEAPMYDGPGFRLKVVRYYEKIPMHYNGEVFRIMCESPNTASSPAHKTQDAGWRTVGNGGAIGSGDAHAIAERERSKYVVLNDTTLAWTGTGFNISFDACGQFRSWYPTMLPREEIDTVAKPEWCAPVGTGDCRHYDFMGDRFPRYSDITIDPGGAIEFTATSAAFKGGGVLRIRSPDAGQTWLIDTNPVLPPRR